MPLEGLGTIARAPFINTPRSALRTQRSFVRNWCGIYGTDPRDSERRMNPQSVERGTPNLNQPTPAEQTIVGADWKAHDCHKRWA